MKMKTKLPGIRSAGLAALLAALAIGAALICAGCPTPEPSTGDSYSITVTTGITNGTITPSTTTAVEGTAIFLAIKPDNGYQLKSLTVRDAAGNLLNVGGTAYVRDFKMPASDVTVSAEFEPIGGPPGATYTISVTAGIANGSITANPAEAAANATITLTISPAAGYQLKTISAQTEAGSSVSINGAGNTRTFTMPASNVMVNGEFEPETFTISTAGIQHGAVTVTSPANQTGYPAGANITLTIAADSGYELDSITATAGITAVALSGTGATRTFTMPAANVTISAVFKGNIYSITINNPANGAITRSPATAIVGTTITLTLSPNAGYKLKTLTVKNGAQDIQTQGSGSIRTFSMPAGDVTVTVEYEALSGPDFTISLPAAAAGGSITSDPTGSAKEGQFVNLTINTTNGYSLKNISVKKTDNTAVTLSGDDDVRSFTMPASNVTVSAEWEIETETSVSVVFDGFYDEVIDLTVSNTVLSKAHSDFIEIHITGDYDSNYYQWVIDGEHWNIQDGIYLKQYSSAYNVGIHQITIIVMKDGAPYSKTVTFEVVW